MKVYRAPVPYPYTLRPRYDLRFLDSTGRVIVHGAGGIVHVIGQIIGVVVVVVVDVFGRCVVLGVIGALGTFSRFAPNCKIKIG